MILLHSISRYLERNRLEFARLQASAEADHARMQADCAQREELLARTWEEASDQVLAEILTLHAPGQYARWGSGEFIVCAVCGPYAVAGSAAGHHYPCPTTARILAHLGQASTPLPGPVKPRRARAAARSVKRSS